MVVHLDGIVTGICRFLNEGVQDAGLDLGRRVEYYEQAGGRCIGRIGAISDLRKGNYLTRAGIAGLLRVSLCYLTPFFRAHGDKLKKIEGHWNAILYIIDDNLISLLPKIEKAAKQKHKWKPNKKKSVKRNSLPVQEQRLPPHGWVTYQTVISELEKEYKDIGREIGLSSHIMFYEKAGIPYDTHRGDVICKEKNVDKLKRVILEYTGH